MLGVGGRDGGRCSSGVAAKTSLRPRMGTYVADGGRIEVAVNVRASLRTDTAGEVDSVGVKIGHREPGLAAEDCMSM